jgi:hypothetical protein
MEWDFFVPSRNWEAKLTLMLKIPVYLGLNEKLAFNEDKNMPSLLA